MNFKNINVLEILIVYVFFLFISIVFALIFSKIFRKKVSFRSLLVPGIISTTLLLIFFYKALVKNINTIGVGILINIIIISINKAFLYLLPFTLNMKDKKQYKNDLQNNFSAFIQIKNFFIKLFFTFPKILITNIIIGIRNIGSGIKSYFSKNKKQLVLVICFSIILFVLISAFIYVDAKFSFKIVSSSPANRETNLAGLIVIKTVFNDKFSIMQGSDITDYFTIKPYIKGYYEIKDNEILFIASENINPSVTYKVSVNIQNLIPENKKLKLPQNFKFYSSPFTISISSFYNEYSPTNETKFRLSAFINTNYAVSDELIKKYITIKDNKGEQPYSIEHSPIANQYMLTTDYIFDAYTTYKIIVSRDFIYPGSQFPIGKEISQEFVHQKYEEKVEKKVFNVYDVSLHNGENQNFISVKFNYPVNPSTIKGNISISPKLPFQTFIEYDYVLIKADFAPNTTYSVTINKSVTSNFALSLEEDFETEIYVSDMNKQIMFGDFGTFMPRNSQQNVSVKTINADEFYLSVRKIYKNNLVFYLQENDPKYFNQIITNTKLPVYKPILNKETETLVNLRNLQTSKFEGMYMLSVSDQDSYSKNKIVIISDIGLLLKNNGNDLYIWAISIDSNTIIPGIDIKLVSNKNQTLYSGKTNANGYLIIENFKNIDKGNLPYLVLAEKGNDFNYILLSDAYRVNYDDNNNGDAYYEEESEESYDYEEGEESFTQSSYGYSGINSVEDKLLVLSERSLYRPGETVNMVLLDRKPSKELLYIAEKQTVKYSIHNPSDSIVKEGFITTDIMTYLPYTLPYGANTGVYQIYFTLKNKGDLGIYKFSCEEFVPHNIEVSITKQASNADSIAFNVEAKYLFGGTASGLKVTTTAHLYSRNYSHENYKGYIFFDSKKQAFNYQKIEMGTATLNENGMYQYVVTSLNTIRPPSSLTVVIQTEVEDESGQIVTAVNSFPYDIYPYYVGIKQLHKGETLKKGEKASFSIISIDPKGKKIKSGNIQLIVERSKYYSIFSNNKIKDFQRTSYSEEIINKVITINGEYTLDFNIAEEGIYNVYVGSTDFAATTFSLRTTDAGSDSDSSANIQSLTITPQKAKFRVNENAVFYLSSRINGLCLVSLESDAVHESKLITIENGKGIVEFPILLKYTPNVFLTAQLINRDGANTNFASIAHVSIPVQIKLDTVSIPAQIQVSEKTDTMKGISVKAVIPEQFRGGQYIFYLVDEGALAVNNFQVPDPLYYFYSKRLLSVASYDNIYQLLPKKTGINVVSIAGDSESQELDKNLNPVFAQRYKIFSYFSGILTPDENGEIQYTVPDMLEFNGKVRVTLIGASDNKFVRDETTVTVKDDITIVAGLTRVFAPNDNLNFPLKIFNNFDKSINALITLKSDGPYTIETPSQYKDTINKNTFKEYQIRIKGNSEIGPAHFNISVSTESDEYTKHYEFAIRPYNTISIDKEYNDIPVNASKEYTFDPSLYYNLRKKSILTIAADPFIKVLESLDSLIDYPHGCTEQTTSKVFPLLYIAELNEDFGRFEGDGTKLKFFIQEGIKKIEMAINENGSISSWPGSSDVYEWTSSYASHFLLEADRLGYQVNKSALERIKKYILSDHTQYKGVDRSGIPSKSNNSIYYFFLKAYLGKPDFSFMEHLKDKIFNDLSDEEKILLALSYGIIGEKKMAFEILAKEFPILDKPKFVFYLMYSSKIRNLSLYLYALTYCTDNTTIIRKYYNSLLSQIKTGNIYNTQENSWMLMALLKANKLVGENAVRNYSVFIDNKEIGKYDKPILSLNYPYIPKKLKIVNKGNNPIYVYFSYQGIKKALRNDVQSNFDITREYFSSDFVKINLSQIKKGDLIYIRDTVSPKKVLDLNGIIIVDILPSCFAVENKRLTENNDYYYQYIDIRDDRIIISPEYGSGKFQYTYVVRVIGEGTFEIPQLYVEKMYEPYIYGYSKKIDNMFIRYKSK